MDQKEYRIKLQLLMSEQKECQDKRNAVDARYHEIHMEMQNLKRELITSSEVLSKLTWEVGIFGNSITATVPPELNDYFPLLSGDRFCLLSLKDDKCIEISCYRNNNHQGLARSHITIDCRNDKLLLEIFVKENNLQVSSDRFEENATQEITRARRLANKIR